MLSRRRTLLRRRDTWMQDEIAADISLRATSEVKWIRSESLSSKRAFINIKFILQHKRNNA